MQAKALSVLRRPWIFPLALLMVGVVAHGLLIPKLGFYWNDWEAIYFLELESPNLGFQFYEERPLTSLVYLALFPITRSNPLAWQMASLLIRWLGLLAIYYTLRSLWPERQTQHRWIVSLMFVFPGYLLQPVSVAFSPHYVAFALYGLSLLLTVIATTRGGRYSLLLLPAIILSAIQIFSMEYFVGLELIRPLLIWWGLQSRGETDRGAIVKRTALYWSPFALVLGVFLWWRLLILPLSLDDDPNTPGLLLTILREPLNGFTTLAAAVFKDARYSLLDVWLRALLSPEIWDLRAKSAVFSLAAGALAATIYTLYFRIASRKEPRVRNGSLRQLNLLGVAALLFGGLPVWLLGRGLTVGMWSDRYALTTMLGSVILTVFAVEWLLRKWSRTQWVLAVLLGFSMAVQIHSTNKFRLDWELQQKLYWELAWRIPKLKEGTALYGRGTFTHRSSYYDATYIVNLLFDPEVDQEARYAYFDFDHFPHLNLRSTAPMVQQNRAVEFVGSTSRVVGFYHIRPRACVRVLDTVYMYDTMYVPGVSDLGLFSNLERISDSGSPPTPHSAIFGAEPPHGWCYYFEKADLARQLKDWESVLDLWAKASSLGLDPGASAEYIPFIEAHARTGRWSDALDLSHRALNLSSGIVHTLCNNWRRLEAAKISPSGATEIQSAKNMFCANIDL